MRITDIAPYRSRNLKNIRRPTLCSLGHYVRIRVESFEFNSTVVRDKNQTESHSLDMPRCSDNCFVYFEFEIPLMETSFLLTFLRTRLRSFDTVQESRIHATFKSRQQRSSRTPRTPDPVTTAGIDAAAGRCRSSSVETISIGKSARPSGYT